MKKVIYILPPLVIVILVLVWLQRPHNGELNQTTSPEPANTSPWVWENPYTGRKVTIPAEWRKAEGKQIQDTLLALTHATGKSVVYIIYEESADQMSLQEFVDVMNKANQMELGTGDFESRTDEDGQDYYYSGGAKYLGDNLVNTSVRIWSDQPDHFWRTVSMTNSEYRELGFDAEQVLNLLIQSTK